MRNLRLALVGTVTLALVGGLGGAVVAQEADVTAPAVVTGTESCAPIKTWERSFTRVGTQYRGLVSNCVVHTSDPRVNGTFRNTFNQDCYVLPDRSGEVCVNWGTHVLDGDDGGWDCAFAGTNDLWGPNETQVLVVCPGTGDYAGLTYVFHHVAGDAQDFGDGTDTHGIIYEGPPPTSSWLKSSP